MENFLTEQGITGGKSGIYSQTPISGSSSPHYPALFSTSSTIETEHSEAYLQAVKSFPRIHSTNK